MIKENQMAERTEDFSKYQDWWQQAVDSHREWRLKAQENLEFVANIQWTSADIAKLKEEGRPSLTINKIKPIIKFLSGMQRQNKLGINIMPRQRTTQEECDILTEVIHHMLGLGNGDFHKSQQFWDGIVTGRGFLAPRIDYENDPIRGDFVIERVSPFSIMWDPYSERYDLSDAEFIVREIKTTLENIVAEFPEKEDEIGLGTIDESDIEITRITEAKDYSVDQKTGKVALHGLKRKRLTLKEYWYKSTEPVWYIQVPPKMYPELPEGGVAEFDNKQDAEMLRNEFPTIDIEVHSRTKKKLNLATVVGTVILQDDPEPFGPHFNMYPFVPFFPERYDKTDRVQDTDHGIVDAIKDPQREINKRRSQQLHIINTMAHSGWLNSKTAGADKKLLEKFGAKPGYVAEYERIKPEQITPSPPSQGHMLLEDKADDDMKATTLVNPDLLGYRAERGEPGVVLQLRQQQGMVGLEPLLDNYRYTMKILGSLLVSVVTKTNFYSVPEIANIVDLTPETEERKMLAIERLLTDAQFKHFNAIIEPEPSTPSQRLLNLRKLLEIAQVLAPMGVMIPPDVLLDATDIPYKEEIKQKLAQMTGPEGQPQEANFAQLENVLNQMNAGSPMTAGAGT